MPLFPVFLIFFIGSIAETNRAPFDLAEAISTNILRFGLFKDYKLLETLKKLSQLAGKRLYNNIIETSETKGNHLINIKYDIVQTDMKMLNSSMFQRRFKFNHKYRNGIKFYSTKIYKLSSKLNILPVITIDNLNIDNIKSYREKLTHKAGIYTFVNKINGKQYIGSAKDLYIRLNEHLINRKSNSRLQAAFSEYGLKNFIFFVYEYFTYENKVVSNKALTDLETSYLKKFELDNLYNFKLEAANMIGYKHTKEALLKMTNRFKDKNNHPMYGKIHSNKTKNLISKKLSRYPLGVGIYDLNNNLIHKFQNNVELSKYLNVSKVTVGKYLNKGLIYKNKYIFKPINID